MAERAYAFDVGQAIKVKTSGIKGKIVARDADVDHQAVVDVTSKNAELYPKYKPGQRAHVMVPVNAYRVEYVGDNGRAASDWWQEDMLVKA